MYKSDDNYKLARKRVKKKKRFYRHLSIYLVMSAFFFLLNVLADPYEWWFFFPMLGWGIFLAIHYVSIFGITKQRLGTTEWEERELKKEMQRMGIAPPHAKKPSMEQISKAKEQFNLDDHLELKEINKEKVKQYDEEDFV